MDDTVYVVRTTLKSMIKELQEHGFIRCHRQYIINGHLVKSIDTNNRKIVLEKDHRVPYSRGRKKEVLKYLNLKGSNTNHILLL